MSAISLTRTGLVTGLPMVSDVLATFTLGAPVIVAFTLGVPMLAFTVGVPLILTANGVLTTLTGTLGGGGGERSGS